MLTYVMWHGFLAPQPLDLFVDIDHNQLTQYCNLPIFLLMGCHVPGFLALQQTGLAVTKGCWPWISPGSHYEHDLQLH